MVAPATAFQLASNPLHTGFVGAVIVGAAEAAVASVSMATTLLLKLQLAAFAADETTLL